MMAGVVCLLLVDPLETSVVVVVGNLLLSEPEGDLSLGGLVRVRAVDEVAADIDGEITTDGSGGGISGVGGSDELATVDNGVLTFPDHSDDGARREVLAESGEEGTGLEVVVVLSGELRGGDENLDTNQLEALSLEASDELSNQTALDGVGLESDEGTLELGAGNTSQRDLLSMGNRQETKNGAVGDCSEEVNVRN